MHEVPGVRGSDDFLPGGVACALTRAKRARPGGGGKFSSISGLFRGWLVWAGYDLNEATATCGRRRQGFGEAMRVEVAGGEFPVAAFGPERTGRQRVESSRTGLGGKFSSISGLFWAWLGWAGIGRASSPKLRWSRLGEGGGKERSRVMLRSAQTAKGGAGGSVCTYRRAQSLGLIARGKFPSISGVGGGRAGLAGVVWGRVFAKATGDICDTPLPRLSAHGSRSAAGGHVPSISGISWGWLRLACAFAEASATRGAPSLKLRRHLCATEAAVKPFDPRLEHSGYSERGLKLRATDGGYLFCERALV